MTIETTTPGGEPLLKSGPYDGDGVATVFDYDFQIQQEDELLVTVLLDGETLGTTLTLQTDYDVAGVGDDDGGQITLASATIAPAGSRLVIEYNGDYNQEVAWSNQGSIQLSILERSFDKVFMHLRSIKELADRSVKVDQFDTVSPDQLLEDLRAARDEAGVSASEAAASSLAASLTLEEFEAVYLGEHTSDPTTDNEGGPLKNGALYYNSDIPDFRIYDSSSSSWVSVATVNATLTSLGDLGTAANKLAYTTDVDTWAEADISEEGREIIANPPTDTFRLIGELFAVWDHLTGSGPPDNSGTAKFIKLTAGLSGAGGFNAGLLINESVSGSAPLVEATAEIATGPMAGETVHLVNTIGAFLRPGTSSGTLQFDQMQRITGIFTGGRANSAFQDGAFTVNTTIGDRAGSDVVGLRYNFNSADSPDARASSTTDGETRPKNVQSTYYMRIV